MLLVPSTLRKVATDITTQTYAPGAEGTQNQLNTLASDIDAVITQRLKRISQTAWYLFADPNLIEAAQMRFLFGQQTATAEMLAKTSAVATEISLYVPGIGCALINPEAAHRNPGQ